MSSLKDIYNALKSDGQFSQTKDYGTFARRMNERGYSMQIYNNLKDAGAILPDIGTFRKRLGVHVWTVGESKAQEARNAKARKTPLGRAQQSVATEKWGTPNAPITSDASSTPESELVRGLREADTANSLQRPIDYTSPGAVKQIARQQQQRQQTVGQSVEAAGRDFATKERRRREQPIVDTGNDAVNRNIVKTEGQLEDEIDKSGKKFADENFSDYIANSIFGERKVAEEKGLRSQNALAQASPFSFMASDRAYNMETDPDKLLKQLTEKVKSDTASLFSKEEIQEKIAKESAYYNMSPENYVKNVLAPSLQQRMADEFDKSEFARQMPKSTAEYIIRGVNDSMLGTILQIGTMTKSQRIYGQQAMAMTDEGKNPYMGKPGTWTKAARGAVSFIADSPVFGTYGKAGAAVTGRMLGNATAQGMRAANTSLAGRIGRMMGQGFISQGLTGVMYGATNAAVQNYSTGDDTSIGNTVKLMAKGGMSEGASWATMGVIGGAVGASIYNVGGLKRIPAKIFQVAMEGVGMHAGGNVAKMIEGEKTDWLSVEGNLQDVANVVVLKLTHGIPKRGTRPDGKRESYLDFVARNIVTSDAAKARAQGLVFTDEEKRQLFGSKYAPERRKSLYGYDVKDNPEYREESLTSWAMRTKRTDAKTSPEESYKDTDVEFVKTAYDQIMADNTIPWDTKAKFSALVMGTTPSARPMMSYGRVEKDANGDFVGEYSKYGELLSKTYYKTPDERAAISYRLNARREDQRLQNAYGAAQIKDEKAAEETIAAVGKEHGFTAEQMKKAMDKNPLRRTDEEQKACIALRKAFEDEQFKPGTLHPEQSELQGKDIAEDNNLGTENPNHQSVVQAMAELSKAENALYEAMDGDDAFGQEYDRLKEQGLSNAQIYQELINSGLTQEQLAPLADYINANAKVQGMFRGTQQAIEEIVQKRVADWGYKGTLNGDKGKGESMVYVTDNKGRTLIVGAGDVSFGEDGRATDGDMLTVFDPQTNEMDFVSVKDVKFDHIEKAEDYANAFRQKLQEINSQGYQAAAQQQAEQGQQPAPKQEEQPASPPVQQPASASQPEQQHTEQPAPKQGEQPAPNTPKFKDGTPVPMTKDSKGRNVGDYSKMTPQQAAKYIKMTFGENAEKAIDGKIKKAEAAVKAAEKMKVDYSADEGDAIEAEAKKKAAMEAAQKELEYYTAVKKAMAEAKVAETLGAGGTAETQPDPSTEVARKKFAEAPRVVGNKRTRTLADGTKIKGHYEIVPAESLTPSHNAMDGYKKSEGFPVNENGSTINDRDYEHDKDAQATTDRIAQHYDGQAVDQVPVVSKDGIVYDGNGRTMAGQKAAKDGTDGAYIEALKENAESFGFTAEQIEKSGIEHPRVVLVTDEPLPYDTATFAKFNRNEKKAQSNTQQAIANSKKLAPDEVASIAAEIEGSGSLEAFFNNPKAINSLLKRLVDKGIVGQNEIPGLREGEDRLSAAGKDFVKNLLLGSVFSEDTIRMMGADGTIKTKALNGIRAVLDNLKLGDYSLKDEIDKAMQLLYEARQGAGGVDALLRTPAMFGENAADRYDPISQAIALALDGKAGDFRDIISAYNRNAEHYADSNQTEMFGEKPTKQEFINEFLKLRNWKNYETRHTEKEADDNAGGTEGGEPETLGGNEPAESQEQVDEVVKNVATEITKQTGIEVVTDENAGQERIARAEAEQGGKNVRLRMSAKKRRALETVSVSRDKKHQPTVVSSADGANVLNNLEQTKEKYEKQSNRSNTFIGDVAKAIGAERFGSGSEYATFETKNGQIVTIRLANHNAHVSGFDHNGRDNGISIVISPKPNEGITNDGNAHIVEFYYDSIKLRRADGKPLAEIVHSIEQALYSGEFKDTTGLAERQEVNAGEIIRFQKADHERFFRTKNGEVYGFTDGEKIYLDTKKMKPETPLHEYTHLWSEALRRANPKEWENVKKLFDKVDGLKEEVKKLYPELEGDDLYDEMIAVFSGREGAKNVEDVVRKLAAEDGKTVTESAKAMGFIERVKTALKTYWKGVADMLHIHFTTAEEVADKVLADWASGLDPRKVEAKKEERKPEPPANPVEGVKSAAEQYKAEQMKRNGQQKEQTPEEKAAAKAKEMEENPLTVDEIESYSTGDEDMDSLAKDYAKDYLDGDKNPTTEFYYNQIYDDVRNRRQDGEGDSSPANPPHVDGGDNEPEGPRPDGGATGRMDGEPSGTNVSGGLPSEKGSEDSTAVSDGEGGNKPVGGATSPVDEIPAGSGGRKRGGNTRRTGATGGKPGTPPKDTASTGENKPDAKTKAKQSGDKVRDLLAQIKAKREANRKNDVGKLNAYPGLTAAVIGELSKKMLPRDKEEAALYGQLIKACVEHAYDVLRVYGEKIENWFKGMHDDLHDAIKDAYGDTLSNEDVDNYIRSLWNTKYTINGKRQTIEKWAAEIGREKLRAALSVSLEEKRKKQQDAEKVSVKVGDADNIAETLPFLLPEQQNDVLKAETQFFDPKHADDAHGNGRGILFTNGTGTGKTYTGLGIAKRFIKQGKGRVLIVTPSPAKVQDWSHDAKNLGITLTPLKGEAGKGATMQKGVGAVVTTFANFRQNRALMEDVFDLVIYDESHKLMENRQAQESATTVAHYRMTNKDFESAMERVQMSHPLWREGEELDAEKSKLLKGNNDVEEARMDPNVSDESIERIEQIDKRLAEIDKEKAKLLPELTKKAQNSVGKTKVVFLSATPFNLRENLEYAEGYLFKYKTPERPANISDKEWQAMRSDARNQFYRQWFPHGERIGKNGRIEPFVSDADKNDVEERSFADHLMDLGVMSGRTIDNGYDYSRDFPTVSVTHADRFNTAVKDLMGSAQLRAAAQEVFDDYNTMSVVYETMKASACAERIKEHIAMGRKVVIFHRRVNDRMGLAQPPFANVLKRAALYATALEKSGGGGKAEAMKVRAAMDEFRKKYADLLQWEQTLDYRMPRQQIASLLGDMHDYTPEEMAARNDAEARLIAPAFKGQGDPYKAGYEFAKTCFDLEDADIVEMYKPHEVSDEEAELFGTKKTSKAQHKKDMDAYNAIAKQVRKGIEDNIRERIASGELKIELDANGKKVRHVGMFAGADSTNAKLEDMKAFNNDDSGMNVMVVQEASGKEGISLHDTTGKHQRVMMNLALPQSPIAFIQAEGRIYRIGQKSNAIFEYPLLGIDNEIMLFARRFNGRAATTENLALGNMARGLKDAIMRGVLTKRGKVPLAGQGYGGREWDMRDDQRATGYDGAVRDWRTENNGDQTGSIDDMDTPQPLGFKLAEWAKTNEGETVLEPSAGNGNVSRYLPSNAKSLSIEPDPKKYNNLLLITGGVERGSAEAAGRRTLTMNGKFENLNAQSKFDTIIMNAPNGAEGQTAKKHLELAVAHLNDSGRIVAVLPETESMEKFVNELVEGNPSLRVTGEVKLPPCAYSIGGVSQKSRVITIDKLTREEMRKSWKEKQTTDLSNISDMETLVAKLKGVTMPDRVLDPAAKSIRYANALKTKLERVSLFKSSKSHWSGVAVSDTAFGVRLPDKFVNSLNYGFLKFERNGRQITLTPIEISGARYEKIKALDPYILAQYKVSTEILKMSDAEIREKCFNWRLKDKYAPLYIDALKQYSEAMTKAIRGISGRTEAQLLRAFEGEDIDNPVQVTAGTEMSVSDYKALFEANNENEELGALFNRVYDVAKNLGLKIDVFSDQNTGTSAYYSSTNRIRINASHWNAKKMVNERGQIVPATKETRAEVLCHELIHSVTSYANYWYDHDADRLPDGLREAAKELDDIYNKIIGSRESYIIPSYAKENKNELVAEMANPAVREPLKKMGIWTRLVNAVKKFFMGNEKQVAVDAGFAKDDDFAQSTVYNELSKTLDKFLNNFDEGSYDAYIAMSGASRDGKHFRIGDDVGGTPIDRTIDKLTKTVNKVAGRLGVKVNTIQSPEQVSDPQVRRDIEAGKAVQGWYDAKTGEVHLYMPNIHCSRDAVKTVWHETVGHKGMRGLLGDTFNDYMRGLWMDLDNPVNAELREYVRGRMAKEPMSMYDAIEEYLADAAENGKGEPSFWLNIKNKVVDALHEIGYRINPNVKDVKYMLWLAKNVQKNPNDPVWKMRADAVKWKIGHEQFEGTKMHGGDFYNNDGKPHDFSDMDKQEWLEATDGEIHYRTAPGAATALDRYHRQLNAHSYMATEAFMDNMLSLKALMQAIDPKTKKIEDIKSSENPYMLQNTMQGAASEKMQRFEADVMQPLNKIVAKTLDAVDGKNDTERIRNFNLYMIKKHGLERNRVFFVRDHAKDLSAWGVKKSLLGKELHDGRIDLKEYFRQMDEWIRNNVDKDYKAEEHDYSGMHGLQGITDNKAPYDDAAAIDDVMNTEQSMESMNPGSVAELWGKIKVATQYALNEDYNNGFVTKQNHDRVSGMFDWYVPLRKFDGKTAEDVYGYVAENGDKSTFLGPTLIAAKGRKSLSNVNILAQIGAMGNHAINSGAQNLIKMAFARFVRNNGGQGLVTETKVWVEKKGVDTHGNDIWEEVYPDIPEGATGDQMAGIVSTFEAKMEAKAATGDAKSISDKGDIGFKFERAKDRNEHFVDVMIAGKRHRFVVLGNPRAAQALNGLLENEGATTLIGKGLKATTRFMAQMATSYAPEFVMRNVLRDAQFASAHVTSKEGRAYAKQWLKYYAVVNPFNGTKSIRLGDIKGDSGIGLYARYRKGQLDMNNEIDRWFKEFMENGGETGWVQIKNMEEFEKEYRDKVATERSTWRKSGKALLDFFFGNVEGLNEMAENMARFATYCASRKSGRGVVRSAYDAKEVSTNFNRHGSGSAIKTFKNGDMGSFKTARRNVYGFLSGYLRNYSMFFNAAIQSTNLLVKNVKHAPVATTLEMASIPFGLGIVAALVNNALIAGEDEKKRGGVKDPYAELPDYIRRNSLCIYKGKGEFVTIPLAIELRAFYGMGDCVAGHTMSPNIESQRNFAMDMAGCASQLLPAVDFMNSDTFDKNPVEEAVKGFAPTALASSLIEWELNSDWKGAPIRRTGDYTKNNPAWKNAYASTPDALIRLNKWANATTNDVAPGNENMKGADWADTMTDPSLLNHIYSTLGGGAATSMARTVGIAKKLLEGKKDEIETKDIPFLRSLMYTPTEQSSMARTKAKWYSYKEDLEKATANYDALKKTNVPLTERIKNLSDMYKFKNSPAAQKIDIIKQADKQLNRWNKMKQMNAGDKTQVDFATRQAELVMQKAVEQMDNIGE